MTVYLVLTYEKYGPRLAPPPNRPGYLDPARAEEEAERLRELHPHLTVTVQAYEVV